MSLPFLIFISLSKISPQYGVLEPSWVYFEIAWALQVLLSANTLLSRATGEGKTPQSASTLKLAHFASQSGSISAFEVLLVSVLSDANPVSYCFFQHRCWYHAGPVVAGGLPPPTCVLGLMRVSYHLVLLQILIMVFGFAIYLTKFCENSERFTHAFWYHYLPRIPNINFFPLMSILLDKTEKIPVLL